MDSIHNKGIGERPTVGTILNEAKKKPVEKINAIELQRHLNPDEDYIRNLEICVKNNQHAFQGDFYVHVETKKDRILEKAIRNYFQAKKDCPTPSYDQSIFRYNSQTQQLEWIWTIPSKDTCELLYFNAAFVVPEEKQLLSLVMKFYDGSLYRLMKKLNNERYDSNILANREPDKKILDTMSKK